MEDTRPASFGRPPGESTAALRYDAPRRTLTAKLAGAIAAHSRLSLAIIVVLAVLLISVYVYYHGLLFLGPYSDLQESPEKVKAKSKSKRKASTKASDTDEEDDPETERLIDSINSQ